VSPYNELDKWAQSLKNKELVAKVNADPHHPNFAIPEDLTPEGG